MTAKRMTSALTASLRTVAGVLIVAVGLVGALAGCQRPEAPPDYVARVGDRYLLTAELDTLMSRLAIRSDSVAARQQLIEQWVTEELLLAEARRLDLAEDPEVRRLLRESERTILTSVLTNRLLEDEGDALTPSNLQAFFERNKEQLRLRQPFARVRYLATTDADTAAAVRRQLQQATSDATADSLWPGLIERYAATPEVSLSLSASYYPEGRFFPQHTELRRLLSGLSNRQIAPVVASDSLYHVLQLVERVPAGTIPEREWIQDELQERLLIQSRKQNYARQVQRLRTEALARDGLEIRSAPGDSASNAIQ